MDKAVNDVTRPGYVGILPGETDYNYNLGNDGVGLGSVSPKVPQTFVSKTKAIATADRSRQDQA